jgi:hypothetical protein
MARRLNSLFETPGAAAHAAYLLVLVFLCAIPLLLLPLIATALPLSRPAMWMAFACPLVLLGGAAVIYGPVRHRVRRLLNSCDERALLRSPCLILRGIIEQPGVAEIVAGRLILVPLFGRQIEIPLDHIESISHSHWFNGAIFESLTGFMVEYPENHHKPIGFAVPDGDSWRAVLPHVNS